MRLFVTDPPDGGWDELTDGGDPPVRVAAKDLQHARRVRARVRATGDVAVILDVTVAVAPDFRSVRDVLEPADGVRYAGTVDGLAGLIADIESAEVADGVTLVPVSPRDDVHALGRAVLHRLESRAQAKAS
ncbi:hypothetical protein [Mycolicibacterium celeriflavum]|uniref:hypothetical protein n=1 Tax=Mycolicibacterium celeriflavum TaxID=1249101 RepID=UPI003CF17994